MDRYAILATIILFCFASAPAMAKPENLGNGFADLGVAAPVSSARGIVATANGQGQDVVLVWLYDHRGAYGLLMINADTGESRTFPTPFPNGGDNPLASLLSRDNKYYAMFNSTFVEFDPTKPGFVYHHAVPERQMAMSMTEDDQGRIWAATFPGSGVVCYNPKTGAFRDYGYVHHENWKQYQRSMATDSAGWVYFGVGNTQSAIIGLNPKTGKAKRMTPKSASRATHRGVVFRAADGKCYGHANAAGAPWFQFYAGKTTKLDGKPDVHPRKTKFITGWQNLYYKQFPDGKRLVDVDLLNRVMHVEDPATGKTAAIPFQYKSEGVGIMGLATASNGTICGATAFPMRFFSYNPKTDQWVRHKAMGQWNTVASADNDFFIGAYGSGLLMKWNPDKPWVNTEKGNPNSNPLYLAGGHNVVYRPTKLLVYSPRLAILAGTPGYGYTGGGLLLWDRIRHKATILTDEQILKNQATNSMVALPDGKLLAGTTTEPGTGGEKKAKQAELYIMDIASRKVLWHQVVFPGVQSYRDMVLAADGRVVYGFAGHTHFFVFDPTTRKVIYQENTAASFGRTNFQQGPRMFVKSPDGKIFILFQKGIATVDPVTYHIRMLAKSPVSIGPGGAYLDGHIYFDKGNDRVVGSHLYSWKVSDK